MWYVIDAPTSDLAPINGALETAHSLFRKYRFELKSQKLWTEIKFVLDTLAKPLTELFVVSLLRTLNESQFYNISNKKWNFMLLIIEIFF